MIAIPPQCLTALKHHKAAQAREKLLLGQAYNDQDLVFCREDGEVIKPRTFYNHFKRMLEKGELPAIRLHDTRHTVATLTLGQGENPKTVQTMLGHSKVAVTLDTYSHVSLELERQAMARLGNIFEQNTAQE